MNKEKIAQLVSRILHPFVIAMITIPLIALEATNYKYIEALKWTLLVILPLIILPVFYLIYLKKSGKIEDFDLSNREQRHKFYPLGLTLIIFTLICLRFFEAPHQFFLLIITLMIIFMINYLINKSSKISIHTSAMSGFMALLLFFYGVIPGLIGLLLSLVVIWSRITLKKHSYFEVTTAAIVSAVITYLIFAYR